MTNAPSRVDVDQVMRHVRSGLCISRPQALEWNRSPLIDQLRAEVTVDDIDSLLRLVRVSNAPEVQGLAVSLLRKVERDSRVQGFLRQRWQEATDFSTRNSMFWRLLDNPELPKSMHEDLYRFVRENWQQWLAVAVRFAGGKESVMSFTKKRLADPSFPESKHWAYLCGSLGAPESERSEVKSLITRYLDATGSITGRVARELLVDLQQPKLK